MEAGAVMATPTVVQATPIRMVGANHIMVIRISMTTSIMGAGRKNQLAKQRIQICKVGNF